MNNFTPEELVMYLYHESPRELSEAIDEALKKDWTLREKMNVLKASMERLDSIAVSPRTEVILNILNYARSTAAEEVK